jgi:SAM-dependent methyltransferase
MAVQQTGLLSEAMHLASRLGEKTRDKGIRHVASAAALWAMSPLLAPLYKQWRRGREFRYDGRALPYFWHRYNMTWRNERAIEVPIAWEAIESARGKRILEVGNVLSHYFAFEHDTLDKYEKVPGVINQDVVDFKPTAPYDLIISISTLEHVGWDETPRDASKIPKAVEAMTNWLAPGGELLVTVPLGYNDDMDEHFRAGRLKFSDQRYYTRVSRDNSWTEAKWDDVSHVKYGVPYPDSSCHMLIGRTRAPV